jgi:hypothetical protein
MSLHDERRKRFKTLGKALEANLELALQAESEGETRSGSQGIGGEESFRRFLNSQLPARFRALSGHIVSSKSPRSPQRDCIIFDAAECPVFLQSEGQPPHLPIEGVAGCIEANTGGSGATYSKLLDDCRRLSEIGQLGRERLSRLARIAMLSPVDIPGKNTLQSELVVRKQEFTMSMPPVLYVFAAALQGNLPELARRIIDHNKSVDVSISVGGAFILDQGYILHIRPGQGWDHTRLPGSLLAYIQTETWEVLFQMMNVIWSHLWKTYDCPNLGPYFADKEYFVEVDMPRCRVIDDLGYSSQKEEGFQLIA